MDVRTLAGLRTQLETRRSTLLTATATAISGFTSHRETHSDHADTATEETDRDVNLRVHEHERLLIRQIDAAIRRIEHGDYGHCVSCGDDISVARLSARPTALQCIDCQTEAERTSRRMRV